MTRAAYQANGHTIAREAFYSLACDPRRSCVVEACAGAGKTWMLVSRILRALLDGAQAHEILAITFTRKAAGEMRERLNDWLRTFGSPMTSHATRVEALVARGVPFAAAETLAPELAGLHERVLREGRAVQVSTFHAWFAQLLRAAPLELLTELGLQQDMSLIEDLDEHRSEVFRRFHAAVLLDPALHADHALLIAQRGRSQVRAWFDAAWDKRVEFELADAAGVLEDSVEAVEGEDALEDATHPTWHPTHALHRDPWRSALRELASALGRGGAAAQKAAQGIVDALAHTEPQATFAACWNALFTLSRTPRKLGQIALLADAQDRLAALAERIHQHESRLEHLRMVRLTRVLLVELAGYKRSRGLAEMADLERCGLALLRDSTLAAWVQERLDARVRHVLIDEFQDTSPLQWHALHAWLAGYAGAGGGASGQRTPGVFIVGDPKQSIYRFRRAEPRVFEAARAFVIEGLGGDVLACDHTRRNAPEMLSVLNAVFREAEDEGRFSGFRTHTTEVPADPQAGVFTLARVKRPPKAATGTSTPEPHWRDSLTTPRLEADTLLREQEAAQVADAVRALLREGDVRAGEIFVLSRKRQSLRLVARALQHRQLPFAAVEEMALMAAAEARDLVALLDVLVSPSHRLSLAQTLRCPLFGCDDADLITLAGRARDQTRGDWWAALVQSSDASSPALARARDWLPRWREAAARLPPHDLLDGIVHEGGFRERVAATVPQVQRAAALDAIDAVLAQALLLDGARYSTPYNFVRALKRRSVKVAPPAHADAVQLLTVHGAKGLEAKLVFVMDAEPEPPRAETTTMLIDWPVDDERPRRCAFVYAESACPPSLQGLLATEQLARSREELNGLYVAMSRAKQRLVFSATEPSRTAPGGAWWARIVPHAKELSIADQTGTHERDLDERAAAPTSTFTMKTLGPVLPSAEVEPVATSPLAAADDGNSRLGQAVHRVLEWALGASTFLHSADAIAPLARAAAIEFDAPVESVAGLAGRILGSATARRFFDPVALRWAGNEVPITDAGELLRIDRLVQLDEAEGPVWWVIDYKLQHAPQELPIYRDQLRRYRDAVRRLQVGAVVRCAFITGAGEVISLD